MARSHEPPGTPGNPWETHGKPMGNPGEKPMLLVPLRRNRQARHEQRRARGAQRSTLDAIQLRVLLAAGSQQGMSWKDPYKPSS